MSQPTSTETIGDAYARIIREGQEGYFPPPPVDTNPAWKIEAGQVDYVYRPAGFYEREAVKNIDPHHYNRWTIEPFEFIDKNDLPFWLGNVIKYCMRYDEKGGVEDLRKAIKYIELKITRIENGD